MNLKATGRVFPEAHRFEIRIVKIHDAPAAHTHHMMMRLHISLKTGGSMVKTDLGQNPVLHKNSDVLVDCGQRNRGDRLAHMLIDFFRTGMAVEPGQRFPDYLTLMSDGETLPGAQFAKSLTSHNTHYYRRSVIQRQVSEKFSIASARLPEELSVPSQNSSLPQLPGSATIQLTRDGRIHQEVAAQLVHASSSAMRLYAACNIAQGTPVRIEVSGGVILGEVTGCGLENSSHAVNVQIHQVIPTVSDLAKLVGAVLGHRPPVSPASNTPAGNETVSPKAIPVTVPHRFAS
jgi:hypothetical protein